MALLCANPPTFVNQRLIANTSVGVEWPTLNTTRLLFNMQLPQWPEGTAVRVFVLRDDHPRHRNFNKDLLSRYPRQLRCVWDRQLYSGNGQAPTTVASVTVKMAALNSPSWG